MNEKNLPRRPCQAFGLRFSRHDTITLSLSSPDRKEKKHGKSPQVENEHMGNEKWGKWKHQTAQQRRGTHDTKQGAAMTVYNEQTASRGRERERYVRVLHWIRRGGVRMREREREREWGGRGVIRENMLCFVNNTHYTPHTTHHSPHTHTHTHTHTHHSPHNRLLIQIA